MPEAPHHRTEKKSVTAYSSPVGRLVAAAIIVIKFCLASHQHTKRHISSSPWNVGASAFLVMIVLHDGDTRPGARSADRDETDRSRRPRIVSPPSHPQRSSEARPIEEPDRQGRGRRSRAGGRDDTSSASTFLNVMFATATPASPALLRPSFARPRFPAQPRRSATFPAFRGSVHVRSSTSISASSGCVASGRPGSRLFFFDAIVSPSPSTSPRPLLTAAVDEPGPR